MMIREKGVDEISALMEITVVVVVEKMQVKENNFMVN